MGEAHQGETSITPRLLPQREGAKLLGSREYGFGSAHKGKELLSSIVSLVPVACQGKTTPHGTAVSFLRKVVDYSFHTTMPIERELKIFVIHCEKDERDFRLLTFLKNHFTGQYYVLPQLGSTRFDITYQDSNLSPTLSQDIGKDVMKKIRVAKHIIAIITENSLKSVWVNQEIGYAFGKSKHCFFMVDERLRGETFGFIHSNIEVQYFNPNAPKIDRINRDLEEKYGSRVSTEPMVVQSYVV
jgi:hypothetical protein